jgi:hypothetical protein
MGHGRVIHALDDQVVIKKRSIFSPLMIQSIVTDAFSVHRRRDSGGSPLS